MHTCADISIHTRSFAHASDSISFSPFTPSLTISFLKPRHRSCGLLGAQSDRSQHLKSTCGRFPGGPLGRNVTLLGASFAVYKGRQEYTWSYPTGLSKTSSVDRKGLTRRKKAKSRSFILTYERRNRTRFLQGPHLHKGIAEWLLCLTSFSWVWNSLHLTQLRNKQGHCQETFVYLANIRLHSAMSRAGRKKLPFLFRDKKFCGYQFNSPIVWPRSHEDGERDLNSVRFNFSKATLRQLSVL